MATTADRIPVPWPQRRELIRERLFPVACFIGTVAACGWLWHYQGRVVPIAVGEVQGARVQITSPYDGELLPVAAAEHEAGGAPRTMLSTIARGETAARIARRNSSGDGETSDAQIVELAAPIAGQVTAAPALVGQHVRRGEPLLTITSPRPTFILCHLPLQWQRPPERGAEVAVRLKGRNAQLWRGAVVEAVGPAVEPAPAYEGLDATIASRGIPVRISLPQGLDLAPGALVEVRFPSVTGRPPNDADRAL
ncbi:MAG TPA: HlyD family secretion protein [Lacipirellulaceae bacterium]|nr:HlyD family secretion protein [Lacipirellulaceae bacterium]